MDFFHSKVAMQLVAQYLKHLGMRPATDDDQAFIEQLYASTRDDLRLFSGNPALVANLIAMQQNLQAAGYRSQFPHALHAILEHRGAPVGRIIVDFAAAEVRLVDIAFLPEARGQGFGRAILHALQQSAHARHLPLALRVHSGNVQARGLYLALGFQVCANDGLAEQMIWRNDAETLSETDAQAVTRTTHSTNS